MRGNKTVKVIAIIVGLLWGVYVLNGWLELSRILSMNSPFLDPELINNIKISATVQTICVLALLAYGFFSKTESIDNSKQRQQIGYSGTKTLDNDSYKIYLTKKFQIQKNEALGKFICIDKLFDSVDEALSYASQCDGASVQVVKDKKSAWIKWLVLWSLWMLLFGLAEKEFGFSATVPFMLVFVIVGLLYQRYFKKRSWHSIMWGKDKE